MTTCNPCFWKDKRVLVTGGAGFIGSYLVEFLANRLAVDRSNIVVPRSRGCDLRQFGNARKVTQGCDIVFHLAAVTGGIAFSRAFPASQYRDSTLIDLNVVEAAREAGVRKLVGLGNLFAYASDVPVPIQEKDLFNGLPTDAHRGVGWMKRNLALLADLYYREYQFPMVVVYSANAYGPRDSLDPKHAHVIPSTIMKCLRHEDFTVWGDGTPTRDFLYAEDVARGLAVAAERLEPPNYVNLGSGCEVSVRELVELVADLTRFRGKISYDPSKGGGDARRCTSVEKARTLLGFEPSWDLHQGMDLTVQWYTREISKRPNQALSTPAKPA
jgi:GDP-L-fucose synthase